MEIKLRITNTDSYSIMDSVLHEFRNCPKPEALLIMEK